MKRKESPSKIGLLASITKKISDEIGAMLPEEFEKLPDGYSAMKYGAAIYAAFMDCLVDPSIEDLAYLSVEAKLSPAWDMLSTNK